MNRYNLESINTIIKYAFIFIGYNSFSHLWEFKKIFIRNMMLMSDKLIIEETFFKEILLGMILLTYCIHVY